MADSVELYVRETVAIPAPFPSLSRRVAQAIFAEEPDVVRVLCMTWRNRLEILTDGAAVSEATQAKIEPMRTIGCEFDYRFVEPRKVPEVTRAESMAACLMGEWVDISWREALVKVRSGDLIAKRFLRLGERAVEHIGYLPKDDTCGG